MVILLACHQPDSEGDPIAAPEPEADPVVEAIVYVGETTNLSAGDSVGESFTWDFGDGASGTGAEATHTWAEGGRYTVRLTAANEDGRTDTGDVAVVAVWEPLATAPTASGRLALVDGAVWAVVPDADQLVVVEGDAVVSRLDTCGHPVSISAAPGVLAVACRDDAVELWDPATRERILTVETRWGARPNAIVADPDGGALVALAGTGELLRVGTEGSLSTIGTLDDPGALAWGDQLFASRFRSPSDGGVVLAGDTTFSLPPDLGPDSDTDARGLPTLLGALALRPDGRALVVAGSKANMDRGLRRDGLALTFETTSRSALRSLDPATGEQLGRAYFDNRDRVGAIAFTPLGDLLLVAHQGAAIVDVLDPFTLTRVGGFQSVGAGLDGLATDGETAWVLASLDRELVAYDLTAGNAQVELARVSLVEEEPLDAEILLGAQVFAGAADPRMSTDAYASCASCHPDGGGDARTWDFSDRGEGFRDTQALFAAPSAGPFHWSANFDEIQDFENAIRAFQEGQGFLSDEDFAATEDPLGEPKEGLSPELDALAAYVRSFAEDVPRSPWREEDGSWTEAAERGRVVFAEEACDTCHAGPEMTDAAWVDGEPLLHDVGTLVETSGERAGGTLTGLRTPGLRGLFATGPWLHDGRASTLEDALREHGFALDTDREADLVRYLLEIEGEP